MPEDEKSVVAHYFRMWNDADTAHISELIGPDWVNHASPDQHSPADVAAAIATAHAGTANLRIYVDVILGEGEFITVNGRIESAGRIEPAVWIVRVTGGVMREMWSLPA